ncbi:glycosyltransferase family 2 protein [Paenibacillus sp. GYB003]|uniref:glycosyltransferase family 2 protein n=1 Tax=Paenibacillus sp. GYB003 TaxID=2994392 RepID=UPI002F960D9A
MKITAITAVYNGDVYLEQSVKSILAQTYRDMEYIIVNDGSSDGTKAILDKIKDPRVRVKHLPKNQGAAFALNLAVRHAKGDWIAVHDADDVSLPHRLRTQSDYVKANPGLVAVGAFVQSISGRKPLSSHHLRNVDGFYNSSSVRSELRDIRYEKCPLCHGSVLFSKAAFLQAGGYDPSYKVTYDYDLWMRLFEIGEIDKIQAVLYQYRVHDASLSHSNWGTMLQEKLRSSVAAIRRQFASKPKPSFVVFGPPKSCGDFKNRIVPASGIGVSQYVAYDMTARLAEAASLQRSGAVDGIIVLDCPMKSEIKQGFLHLGLRNAEQLFVL